MLVVTDEITIAEIDEALNHMREKLQDRYGNRLTWKQKQLYWASIDDLLEARLNLTEGKNDYKTNSDSPAIS
jgi:hypothetical protein